MAAPYLFYIKLLVKIISTFSSQISDERQIGKRIHLKHRVLMLR